tara:strand:+ start:1220 stop:1660 length:441 start_codon:yes stop_codon:yes gene_type:complete
MKLHKFINIRLFVFLCFCFVSNLSFAQFNELGNKISRPPIDIIFFPNPILIGETNIIIPNNRIQKYRIKALINNNSWEVIKGEIISYDLFGITVKWNAAGVGRVKCTPAFSLTSYSLDINITSTLTGNETSFTYDTSGNQIKAKLD